MATAAELLKVQKAILRHVDPGAAEAQAAAGTTVAQYTEALLKQAETSTLPALIVFEHVFGRTQSEASLDNPMGGAAFAAKQFAYYRDVLQVGIPTLGPYEAFGSALAGTDEFHALSDGRDTLKFISEQYDSVFGRAITSGVITPIIRTAGIAALVKQVEYFDDLYRGIKTPSGAFISPAEALNMARAAVLGQILGIAAVTPDLGLTLVDDAKKFLQAAVAGTAAFEESFETTLSGILKLTVQQVADGVANGKHYILADRLDKVVANPDAMKNADSYQLTNATGGVGAVTVEGAKVLLGASNATNFDYSLADSGTAIKAASAAVIAEADTIAVIAAPNGETLDFSKFGKSVILNGKDGNDVLRGTAFNDVYYGGGGANSYYTNGGVDTLRLTDGALDFIFLTKSASGNFSSGPMHIYGFGKEDKFIISNADFSTNLEGSWTKDDYYESSRFVPALSDGNMVFDKIETHAIGIIAFKNDTGPVTDPKRPTDFFGIFHTMNAIIDKDAFEMKVKWKGFFIMDYDSRKESYIYYADSGSDTIIDKSEVNLVAVLHESPSLYKLGILNTFML